MLRGVQQLSMQGTSSYRDHSEFLVYCDALLACKDVSWRRSICIGKRECNSKTGVSSRRGHWGSSAKFLELEWWIEKPAGRELSDRRAHLVILLPCKYPSQRARVN